MVDFDHSPRSSKRRRTSTYATRRTTLSNADADSSRGVEDEAAHEDQGVDSPSQVTAHDEILTAVERPNSSSASSQALRNSRQKSRRTTSSSAIRASGAREQETGEATPTRRKSKRTEEYDNAEEENTEREKEAETPEPTANTTRHTRSSGRTRRLPKRFAEKEDSTDGAAVSQRKNRGVQQAIRGVSSPARQESLPQPKGILTPSRRGKRAGPRKSVLFDGGENDDKRIEEQLGFKDINSSGKKKRGKYATKGADAQVGESRAIRDEEHVVCERAATPLDTENDDDDALLFDAVPNVEEILAQPLQGEDALRWSISAANVEDNEHVIKTKIEVLNRLTSRSLGPVAHLEKEYTTLVTLLSATITAGESNSLLLLGARGSGKTLLIEHALQDLMRKYAEDFHVVRLNGFFQTDDKLALREIWRQLGREMAVSEDETGEVSSYADTMASLLSLLSHPEEFDPVAGDTMDIDAAHGGGVTTSSTGKTSKSIVFILDEFDLFTTHPRQTLLYNLFDIAQAKKAPIAVLGCSTRMDVVDLLEKRVKSRFSHRWLHVASMKSLVAFEDAVRGILCVAVDGREALGVSAGELQWRGKWNEFIQTRFLSTRPIQALLKKIFYSTKSIPDLMGALYVPIATLDLSEGRQNGDTEEQSPQFVSHSVTLPSLLALLPELPTLHLALLVAGARLETIHNLTTVNFALTFSHYTDLLTRSKLQRSAYSSLAGGGAFTGAGLRSWSKDTVRGAWEDLAAWEVIVPVARMGGNSTSVGKLGDEGLGSDGAGNRMFRLDITLDEVSWAVKQKLGTGGAGDILTRWCKEV